MIRLMQFVLDVLFFSNITESDLLEGDSVVLNCHIHSYGNLKPNVTVELTDKQSGRLTFEEYSPVNEFIVVQYNVSLTSSMSGPFYCTVTATVVAMETVSKTLSVTLNPVQGMLFTWCYHIRDSMTVIVLC